MRVIKFRAWDNEKNYFCNDGSIAMDGISIYCNEEECYLDENIFVIEQFIGLTDKNGKEIYEGDILQTPNGDWGVVVAKGHCFEVTVSENQSSFYRSDWMQSCKVIGNIHENPEIMDIER